MAVAVWLRVCDSLSVSVQQEGGLKLTFQKQGLPLKRALEPEDAPLGQQQYLARLHDLQSASDTGLADFTKPQASFPHGTLPGSTVSSCLQLHFICLPSLFSLVLLFSSFLGFYDH